MTDTSYYAALLHLRGRLCIVIGGGRVAERKIGKLLDCDARVRVISPEVTPKIQAWVDAKTMEWVNHRYQNRDLAEAVLVFAATDDRGVNRLIYEEAERTGKLVNVVDDPDLCSLMVPATYQQGSLQIAISTSGTSPVTAKRLRQVLEDDLANDTFRFQTEVLKYDYDQRSEV